MKKKIKVKTLEGTPFLISQQQQIGRGAFARVVRAYKKDQPSRQLVVKIIPIVQENKQSIIAENKILKQIPNHQNLVNCIKMQISTERNYYLIMEYCNGGSFQKYIEQNHNCSQQIVWRFLREFVRGYRVLYDCHLIHRDIKPQNILIHNGKFKIADFGFTRRVNHHNLTQNLSIKGTPLYIAPELQSQSAGSSKIDVFSLGIVLYRLAFNGKHPFHNQKIHFTSLQQYFQHVLTTQLKFPKFPKRSQTLTTLLEKMLQKDPQKRIGWKQIFQLPELRELKEKDKSQASLSLNSESEAQFTQLRRSIIEIGRSSASLEMVAEPFNFRDQVGAEIERIVEFTEFLPTFEVRGLEIFVVRSKVIMELIKHLNGILRSTIQQHKLKINPILQQIIVQGLLYIQYSLQKLIQIISSYQKQLSDTIQTQPKKLIKSLYLQSQHTKHKLSSLQTPKTHHPLSYQNLLYNYLTEYPQLKPSTKQKLKIPTALMIDLYDGLLKLESMVVFNSNGRIEIVDIELEDAELDKIDYENLGTYQVYLDEINQVTLGGVEGRLKSMGLVIL